MNFDFEINNPKAGKWSVTLVGPTPTDNEGIQRVKRSQDLVRYALEQLASEPNEVTLARTKSAQVDQDGNQAGLKHSARACVASSKTSHL